MEITIGYQAAEPAGLRHEGQAALDRLFPRSTMLSWLLLDWEPGVPSVRNVDNDGPIGRWCVRQMIPADRIMPDLHAALRGPNPRTLGEWKYNRPNRKYFWYSHAQPGCTMQTWTLYHRYHCEARLLWIIQGHGGGHQSATNPLEQKYRRMLHLPPTMPAMGDLPYADPDWRVWDNLIDLDQVRSKWLPLLDLTRRTGAHMARQDQARLEELRWAIYTNWCNQVDQAVDERAKRWWAYARSEAPKGTDEQDRLYESTQEQFITDRPLAAVGD